jgi:hypothetical protein
MLAPTVCGVAGCGGAADSADEPTSTAASVGASTTEGRNADGLSGAAAATTGAVSDSALVIAEPALKDDDWSQTWRQLPVPAGLPGARVVATPSGWIAVSSRILGSKTPDTKAPSPTDAVVYRSNDGTRWHRISVGTGDSPLYNAHLAYGAGHYVITGDRSGATSITTVVLDSTDGDTWHEQTLYENDSWADGAVKYVHDRFFFMADSLWASLDGEHWNQLKSPYKSSPLGDIAYGNGLYFGIGLQTVLSGNGTDWQAAPIDCALQGACISQPDGSFWDITPSGLFSADDHFRVRLDDLSALISRWFTSIDGEAWQLATDPAPDSYVSGHFARLFNPQPLLWGSDGGTAHPIDLIDRTSSLPSGVTAEEAALWSAQFGLQDTHVGFRADQTLPDELDFSWNDGLDCTRARCFVATLGDSSALFLVP